MKLFSLFLGFWAIFPSQQQTEQQAVAGISTNINIECNLGRKNETPFWIIDGTVYELFSIPTTFLPDVSPAVIPVVESYSGLTIPLATVELDETTFQCAIFSKDGVVVGSVTLLRIVSNPLLNATSVQSPVNGLVIIYEDLHIDENMVTLKWTNLSCSILFELQGYTFNKITTSNLELIKPDAVIRINNSDTAEIPSANFTTTGGDPLHYRLVALSDNVVCSHQETKTTFHRFDASPILETRVVAPNSMVCYNVPTTEICPLGIRFLWHRASSDRSCSCPVHNSSDGRMVFQDCVPCHSEISPQFMENGSICFIASRNDTVVHFECSNDELCIYDCPENDRCIEGDCFIKTILATHRIVISDTTEPDTTEPDTTEPDTTDSKPTETPTCPDIAGSLYFEHEGIRYESGSSVLITEVGTSMSSASILKPDTSLVCVTSEVNTRCCRKRDGGNIGEWHFPDGSLIPRNQNNPDGDFTRSGYTQQLRLNRRNDALEPSGIFSCMVPQDDGCGAMMHIANITLELPVPREVRSFCEVSVWKPPSSPFDIYSGYDIRYFIPEGGEEIIRKSQKEFFHIITEEIGALGPQKQILVQVRVTTVSTQGPWSKAILICNMLQL